MQRIDYSDPDPAVNLALEEVLLEAVEEGRQASLLRFWESPVPFVVVGTGQAVHAEVNVDNCAAAGVSVLRRCSAGGCVLQGPGSLNFALFLDTEAYPDVGSLHASYQYILGRVCAGLRTLGIDAAQSGISDIALGGRKVSGNAQRRRRRAILHHGTLLYRADAHAMARYIQEPQDRPDYRGDRCHSEFITTIAAPAEALRGAIAQAFEAEPVLTPLPSQIMDRAGLLAIEKYRNPEWTYRR